MDHKDKVRLHYDTHAAPQVDTRQALQQRSEGPTLPLKRFHNDIKRQLLIRFAKPKCTVLDLCCGRGGDIRKWKDAGVARALGVDLSPGEVEEAKRRYEEMVEEQERRKKGPLSLQCQFEVCDTLGDAEYLAPRGPYDMVTCMFAMHYFFESEKKLRMFLRNVSRNLKPGGYFIGTIPDGKRVLWHLGGRSVFDSPFLRLERKWQESALDVQPFGHQYLWALHDTVTAGAGESEGSLEFLTFTQPIVRMAVHYGLAAVFDYDDPELEQMFEPEDRDQVFKHFQPSFPQSDPSLMVASSTFMAFVFRKLRDNEEPPALQPPLLKTLPPPDQWGPAHAQAPADAQPPLGHTEEQNGVAQESPPLYTANHTIAQAPPDHTLDQNGDVSHESDAHQGYQEANDAQRPTRQDHAAGQQTSTGGQERFENHQQRLVNGQQQAHSDMGSLGGSAGDHDDEPGSAEPHARDDDERPGASDGLHGASGGDAHGMEEDGEAHGSQGGVDDDHAAVHQGMGDGDRRQQSASLQAPGSRAEEEEEDEQEEEVEEVDSLSDSTGDEEEEEDGAPSAKKPRAG